VQCNCGGHNQLRIAGVPVGPEIEAPRVWEKAGLTSGEEQGSIIIVVATDAPLLPHQLKRLARRASLGLARTGSTSGNGSGDIFMAFSTANPEAARLKGAAQAQMIANGELDPIFSATAEATEEAIVNALVAAETMTGADDHTVLALPHDRLREVLRKYGRLQEKGNP